MHTVVPDGSRCACGRQATLLLGACPDGRVLFTCDAMTPSDRDAVTAALGGHVATTYSESCACGAAAIVALGTRPDLGRLYVCDAIPDTDRQRLVEVLFR
jgi:hypothetical protein